jgi:hypothetical protein
MSLRRPFKLPRSKETVRQTKAREVEIDRNVGRQTAAVVHRKDNSEWGKRMEKQLAEIERRQQAKEGGISDNPPAVSEDEEDSVPISQLLGKDKDEDDSVPISQLLGKDKAKEVPALASVTELYVDTDVELPPLFQKGHSNLDKTVAKFFDKVLPYATLWSK